MNKLHLLAPLYGRGYPIQGVFMMKEMNFEYEFSSLENAMKYAGDNESKAIITRNHQMYYVVNCTEVEEFQKLGFDHI